MEGGPSLVVTSYLLVVIQGLQRVLSAGRLPALPSIYLDSNDNLTPADLMENLDLICDSKDMNTKPDALTLQGHYVSGSQLLYIDTLFRYVLMSVFPPLTVGSAHKGGNGESRGAVREWPGSTNCRGTGPSEIRPSETPKLDFSEASLQTRGTAWAWRPGGS